MRHREGKERKPLIHKVFLKFKNCRNDDVQFVCRNWDRD